MTAAAAMVWATHRDWNAAEVANALVRSARPLGEGRAQHRVRLRHPRRQRARCTSRSCPIRTSRTTGPRPRCAQRPLHPGAVVVASLGYAGDHVDAYTVDVPAGRNGRAVLRRGGSGVVLKRLPVGTSDVARSQPSRTTARGASQIALPAGRSLVVVARGQGAGAYTLALSGS